ncbi:MAG: hypothetical protein Tsb009_19660 [Planctomycetaceae bacterium]
MASSNNITAVHFSLIFFVMLSIILGVVSYMKINEASEARKLKQAAEETARKRKTELDNTDDAANQVKSVLGYNSPIELDSESQNTFLSRLQKDLAEVGALHTQQNWGTDLNIKRPPNLREASFVLKAAYDRIKSKKEAEIKTLEQLKKDAEDAKQRAETERDTARQDLVKEQARVAKIESDAEEAIKAKQQEIDRLAAVERTLKARIDAERDNHAKEVAKLQKQIDNLMETVARKQEIIDEIKQVSFEKADGFVRLVNHRTGLVWINLGSADGLPERITFSVYNQAHNGVGRGREDIKGAIEVTRITGPHMAEARIIDSDIYNSIRAGDPIYTPLWSRGVVESFAFVGFFDLDGDGKSDRDVLKRKVAAAKAVISNEVDDLGNRKGTGLTTDDKFLVVGKIFDPDLAATDKEREIRRKIAAGKKQLEDEARQKGIRIIRMADFLAYIGFKADRRLWRPGENSPRKLKAGAHSTTINETIGDRRSSGQTSGVYSRSKRLKQPKSTGQTSKIFGGAKGGY